MHFFQGENCHRNHHARPGIARLGLAWRQPDACYAVICILEMMGLVSEVRWIRVRPSDALGRAHQRGAVGSARQATVIAILRNDHHPPGECHA
jgi:hypothetical protein